MLGAFLAILSGASPAPAHSTRADTGPIQGIAIPNLTHGQMAVMERWSGTVRVLADRQVRTDERFSRIRNFAAIQRVICIWGVVPGSVADEDSPFNECMHATLSAERAMLVEMLRLSPRSVSVREVADRIEREMILGGASLVLCRFSEEGFDTASVVHPALGSVLTEPHVAGTLALGGLGAGGLALRRRTRPRMGRDDATDTGGSSC